MRLSIRAKQIAGVTAIVGLSVVALSTLYVARLTEVVVNESKGRADLIANVIYQSAHDVVRKSPDPVVALRTDEHVRSIVQSSLYDKNIAWAAIQNPDGMVIAHSDPTQLGQPLRIGADLGVLSAAGPVEKLRVIYSGDGQMLDVRKPVDPSDASKGIIRVAVSTLLMRNNLTTLLKPALYTVLTALVVSVFVAALLAQLLVRPIHVIRSGLTRLGKGEFGVTLDLPPGDEFGELGTFFNTISQQLSADRSLLAGQKAHLQTAVEHLEDAVALFNPSGELLFTNPAMQATLPDHAIGRALQGLLAADHPYRTIVEETLASKVSRGPVQVQSLHPGVPEPPPRQGSERRASLGEDMLVLTHAIVGMDGALVGVLLVSRNLAYLSRMQSTLAYSRKLVALGRLTAGIAHEVKNPLNAMMIHLELLRTKIRAGLLSSPTAPKGRGATELLSGRSDGPALSPAISGALQHVEIIESEIRRLDEVVQGFLKFSRPEDLRLQPVPVSTIFGEILPILAPEAQKNSVRVEVGDPATLPTVNGDASMLRQAFLNLAINACQAMPHGGMLRLGCGRVSADRVEVVVEDSGVGIPPENLEKIFDLYFTTKDHGTGIGLSMVYRIVQLHDGEIEVQSTPGRGTTFRVSLPRANE